MKQNHALKFYDTLKRIAKGYQTPEQLRKNSDKQYGISYEESLEMAYENLQQEAADAIRGVRVNSLIKPDNKAKAGKSKYSRKQIEEWRKKAERWEKLDDDISKFYCNAKGEVDEDNPERKGDLTDIGEVAARALNWL